MVYWLLVRASERSDIRKLWCFSRNHCEYIKSRLISLFIHLTPQSNGFWWPFRRAIIPVLRQFW
jgi:hypothetical protein